MAIITDARGQEFETQPDSKIVSLVPSLSEFILDMGFPESRFTGRTAYCKYPSTVIEKIPSVGSTKKINFSKIRDLKPDLIIANMEENTAEMVEKIEKEAFHPRVFVTRIESVDQALNYLGKLAALLQLPGYHGFRQQWQQQQQEISGIAHGSVAYFVWKKPWMAAGPNTFITSWLNILGFENYIQNSHSRYPVLTDDFLAGMNADYIFLSSEPYPFSEHDGEELRTILKENTTPVIKLVDGEAFSWYGSRMLKAIPYFKNIVRSLLK